MKDKIFCLIICSQIINNCQCLTLQIKNQEWNCFKMKADPDTVLDVDYLITGNQPFNVDFAAF